MGESLQRFDQPERAVYTVTDSFESKVGEFAWSILRAAIDHEKVLVVVASNRVRISPAIESCVVNSESLDMDTRGSGDSVTKYDLIDGGLYGSIIMTDDPAVCEELEHSVLFVLDPFGNISHRSYHRDLLPTLSSDRASIVHVEGGSGSALADALIEHGAFHQTL